MTRPSRISRARVLDLLRLAARKGDRAALTLALDQMKTLAYTPRYWDKYLDLIAHPMARLADLLVIKQGDKIAHQKGWKLPKPAAGAATRAKKGKKGAAKPRGRKPASTPEQPSLFDL